MLDLLAQGPRSVAELATTAGLGLTSTSAHLQVLKSAGLVAADRDGTTIRYALTGTDVARLLTQVRAVAAAHLPDVAAAREHYLGDPTTQIGREELLRRARAGEVMVLDVRPATEYSAGHIPGAVCIPIDELPARLTELPGDRDIVAYCRGAYCVFAHDAVRLLNARGRNAVRLAEGMLEWRLAGHPVSTGAA